MENLGDPRSTIDSEIAAFDADAETALTESTITDLIATYPYNVKVEHILLKTIVINALYHARVLDVDMQPIANYMTTLGLDALLKAGDPKAVDLIWKARGTRQQYPSFATKYCSWHNHEAYAIYDTNVWEALTAYRRTRGPFTFRDKECDDYAGYLALIKRFREAYGLNKTSLKHIDKFLWIVGGRIIAAKPKKARSKPTAAVEPPH